MKSSNHCNNETMTTPTTPSSSTSNISCAKRKNALELLREEQKQHKIQKLVHGSSLSSKSSTNNNSNILSPSILNLLLYPYMSILLQPMNMYANTNNGNVDDDLIRMKTEEMAPLRIGLGITEISGEAGCGKTQICLSLCVSCVLYCDIIKNNTGYDGNMKNITTTTTTTKNPIMKNPYAKKVPLHFSQSQQTLPQTSSPTFTSSSSLFPHHDKKKFKAIYLFLGHEGGNTNQISTRLEQIILSRICRCTNNNNSKNHMQSQAHTQAKEIMSCILIRRIRNMDEFRLLIHNDLPRMLTKSNNDNNNKKDTEDSRVGLIVMDSMSGLFRLWEDTDGSSSSSSNNNNNNFNTGSSFKYTQRSEEMFQTATQLKKISDIYNVPIVVTNQVTSSYSSSPLERGGAIPALGLSWSNCVNTRYVLTRKEKSSYINNNHHHNTKTVGMTRNNNNNNSQTSSSASLQSQFFERFLYLTLSSKHRTYNKLHSGSMTTIQTEQQHQEKSFIFKFHIDSSGARAIF